MDSRSDVEVFDVIVSYYVSIFVLTYFVLTVNVIYLYVNMKILLNVDFYYIAQIQLVKFFPGESLIPRGRHQGTACRATRT